MAETPVPIARIKGSPVVLFASPGYGAVSPAADKLSDASVDCRAFNAVSVTIYIPVGFTVSATIKGSPDQQGIYLTLPDAQASQASLTTSKVFDCTVGQGFVKIELSGITVPSNNPPNNGIVVIVTPYDAAGQSNITITATAGQDLVQVGGASVALGQTAMADSIPVVLSSDETVPVSATQLPAALGHKTMAASLPVTIASDQATVPVSDTQLPAALGQTTMSASLPVAIASDQGAVPVSVATLPTGLGQKAMAASLPVVLASDQSSVTTHAAVATTGGATHTKLRNLEATVSVVKASAGTLYGVQVLNSTAATAFVQLFDLATGSVTLGTTTPDLEMEVAAGTTVALVLPLPGIAFATAISAASTTTEGGATGSATGVQLFAQYA